MAKTARIRTPWLHQLNLLRVHFVPSGVFVICAVLTVWLWNRQLQPTAPATRAHTISTSVEQPESPADESPTDLDALSANESARVDSSASVQ